MTLIMKRGKDCVRFEVTDEEVESTVTLLPEDDEQTLLRKLRRVIALVEPKAPEPVYVAPGAFHVALAKQEREGSWTPPEPPEIPDRLKGEVELEDAAPVTGNGWHRIGDGEGLPSA